MLPRYYFVAQEDLGLKYTVNFKGSFGFSSSPWVIQPAAYMAIQNKATDIMFGSIVKYNISENSSNFSKTASIGFGGYYRIGDGIIPKVQLQWDSFALGMSYDVNSSELSVASRSRGGFEISLKYVSQNSVFGNQSKARFF